MSSRPTKGLIALNADGGRVDDARRRLLADWLKLVGQRLQDGPHGRSDAPDAPDAPDAGIVRAAWSAGVAATSGPADRASSAETPVLPPAVAELGLPPRMSQVLVGLLAGSAEKQIARQLTLSPHTVHAYVKQLYKRLAVSSRGELLARFVTLNR